MYSQRVVANKLDPADYVSLKRMYLNGLALPAETN